MAENIRGPLGQASPLNRRTVSSIADDARLVTHDIAGSMAHARMLESAGLLSREDAAAVQAGLRQILQEWTAGRFQLDEAHEDVHMNVERRLTEITPAGARLHAGRSRNDQIACDLKLWTLEACDTLLASLGQARAGLEEAARRHTGALLPGITHMQHAQVVELAQVLGAWSAMLARDAARFTDARRRCDVSPLGAAALAGSSLPLDPARTAGDLGFAAVFDNPIDAVGDRDFSVEFIGAAALLMAHLSQMAEILILWCTPEYGFVTLPDDLCTGSSLMPQKRNPDMIEMVRGQAGGVTGDLVSALTTLKGLPFGYNRDLQALKAPLFRSFDIAHASLQVMTAAISRLQIDRGRMLAQASDPQMLATDLAEHLVRQGVAFREAHAAVARLARRCADEGIALSGLSLARLREAHPAFQPEILSRLTPQASAAGRSSTPAPLAGSAPTPSRGSRRGNR